MNAFAYPTGDVTQVRIPEEAPKKVREPLQPVQRRQRLGIEVIRAPDTHTADAVVLDVLPHPLDRGSARGRRRAVVPL